MELDAAGEGTATAATPGVSVVIPTFRRPDSLARAIESCVGQTRQLSTELVVVDNCPDGSAREVVRAASVTAPFPVRYVQEPRPGVAAARNAGVSAAHAPLVAFLDDDNEADRDWLAALVRAQKASRAGGVFGAVVAAAADAAQVDPLYLRPFTRLFRRRSGPARRAQLAAFGTGNALFTKRALGPRPFDPDLGLSGGEDSAFIKRLVAEGWPLWWAPEARVTELVPAERTTLRYTLKRRFSSGQVRTATCVTPPAEPLKAATWMAIGAAQAAVYGALAVAASAVRSAAAPRFLCEAVGGAGKVLWMPPFRVRRYPTASERART